MEDLFKSLGPIAVFSAKRHWSAPRLVQLQKHREGSRRQRNHRIDDYEETRNGTKRDRSEDNSTYYNQIIRSDQKYAEDYEKKKLHRVTKQNGVYINSYNNNNFDYHPKVLDYDSRYEYRGKNESDRELNGRKGGRERKKEPLRRVASEYNVSAKDDEGFGFSVRGDAPVTIAAVEPNSLADVSTLSLLTSFSSYLFLILQYYYYLSIDTY